MDDDWKEYRRNKPQQKLYKPGSGPLRRSGYALDPTMNSYDVSNGPRGREQNHYGSKNSIYEDDLSSKKDHSTTRHRKPEQPLYVPRAADLKGDSDRHSSSSMRSDSVNQSFNKRHSNNKNDRQGYSTGYSRGPSRRDRGYVDTHNKDAGNNDVNYNRSYRQVSEPRSVSPSRRAPTPGAPGTPDRNRDTRSMETSGRHNTAAGGKPPSGRRNSAGYPNDTPIPKYRINLENLPPRLKKKFLEQSGHSFDSADHNTRDRFANNAHQQSFNPATPHNQTTTWSQTLPTRGRGRLRDNESFDRDKFINTYLKTQEIHNNSRRSTPSSSYMNLYEPHSIESHVSHADSNHVNHVEHPPAPEALTNGAAEAHSRREPQPEPRDEAPSGAGSDSEPASCGSTSLMDMTNLDWTEEVEKSMKLESGGSSSSSPAPLASASTQDPRVAPRPETKEAKRSARSKRRDKRSSSRGQKKSDRRRETAQTDIPAPAPARAGGRDRRDSGPQDVRARERRDSGSQDVRARERRDSGSQDVRAGRERRDSHRSNRSSNIGNSRDDLDRWRSLRSFSREQSAEGRIVSQCNSRDTSANRALSPRDNDGFRVPSAVPKNAAWTASNQKKSNGSWVPARTPSVDRGRESPVPDAAPEPAGGGGRRSRRRAGRRRGRGGEPVAPPVPHPAGATPAPTNINWRDEIKESKKFSVQDRLDRHQEVTRPRLTSTASDKAECPAPPAGLLVLPTALPQANNHNTGREGSTETQKMLYDPHNPSRPIMVSAQAKQDPRMNRAPSEQWTSTSADAAGAQALAARHRSLLQQVDRADAALQAHLAAPAAARDGAVADTRKFLQEALEKLLMTDLKYCQADNIEHHFWKILYYNSIEVLRKRLAAAAPADRAAAVAQINAIIDDGNTYFEQLVQTLEKTYKFNTEDYINDNHCLPPKGLGYVGLALVSVQKLYVFLGDLARYKEQVNETNNYAKSKFWYTKAQQVNPKNGRPYNQLAILAIYARRKLDAVYYYMRSLMSSNPFHSARESLISLFDENRKKYEAAERKRRALLEANNPSATTPAGAGAGRGLRREVWVRPSGGRTTRLRHDRSPDDRLASMTPVELNKNFITSYLHVHGKLVTKIGMESFHASSARMLREFRALLHLQPLPTPAARLLQLTALNMFAVETNAPSGTQSSTTTGSRSAWLECAVSVALLMFGALLERCCALLPAPPASQQRADALLLLPAIKVWSDWMLCHSSVWNPPPSFDNYDIGTDKDPWDWLARLMNILETLDDKSIVFETEMKEGYSPVRLPEDSLLAGFTPLMYMEPAAAFVRRAPAPAAPEGTAPAPPAPPAPLAPHLAEHALRTRKLLFFGTEYLVGVEPAVLRLECPAGAAPRYASCVPRAAPPPAPLHALSEDSAEEEEDDMKETASPPSPPSARGTAIEAEGADEATRRLLRRKEQLEDRRATMERRQKRMQELVAGGWVRAEVTVRPRWLVPDTNCFIEHLPLLTLLARPQPYLLAVPLVVVTELEGLSRCGRVGAAAAAALAWLGVVGGAGAAGGAGAPPGVRFATSRGSLLASAAFTAEQETARATNDDRVLATALNLHANIPSEPESGEAGSRRVCSVVLLTDDRNLRVKALAADLPARDLPSFVAWAALTDDPIAPEGAGAAAQ
ncbi:hypothetical protein JYU34_007854 [Plutella xylostella]|uniref:PIN domain-containing protein n=1 Tax=Plutella xylostella TaxID=51655 RepID=A0ABQ7QRI7_PLUXY|nr:hypothetical protein JYU34_007854 [Plutella xylostella]